MFFKRKIDIWSLKTPCTNWRSHYSEWLKCLSIMQSAQFLSSWFPWKSMDPLTFDSDLMFALIIFQLYGQKWEEAASEIENHLPLYQPFSICLLTDISRNDLPLLFNHSSSLSLVIVKKMSRFNVLSFSEAVSHFDSSFACFSSTGCPKMKVPYWILRTTFGDWSLFSGLPPNSVGIVLGHPVYSCLPSKSLPPQRCPEADWRKKETPLIICLLHLHPFHFPDWYYPNFQGCRQLFFKTRLIYSWL